MTVSVCVPAFRSVLGRKKASSSSVLPMAGVKSMPLSEIERKSRSLTTLLPASRRRRVEIEPLAVSASEMSKVKVSVKVPVAVCEPKKLPIPFIEDNRAGRCDLRRADRNCDRRNGGEKALVQ